MSYESQEEAIANRASGKGVPMSQVQSYFNDSLARVRREYPSGRSTDWLLSRAEYLVWSHFFPGDAFPGKIEFPLFPAPNVKTTPVVVKSEKLVKVEPLREVATRRPTTTSTDVTAHDWVHDKFDSGRSRVEDSRHRQDDLYRPRYRDESYGRLSRDSMDIDQPHSNSSSTKPSAHARSYVSQAQLIKEKAKAFGVDRRKLETVFQEKIAYIEDRYPNQSRDWQQWAIEQAVWARLVGNAQSFPGIEPGLNPGGGGNSGGVASRPSTTLSLVKSQTVPDKLGKPETPPDPSGYQQQEKTMEAMAVKLGIRREFFQFLQKARDQAREDHRECSSGIRHFVADRITWLKFFKQPFPHVHPRQGHSAKCKFPNDPASHLRRIPPSAPARVSAALGQSQINDSHHASARPPTPALEAPGTMGQSDTGSRYLPPSIPPADMIVALGNVRQVHHNYGGGIVLQGTEPTFCKVYQVDEMLGCFRSDKSLAIVGEGLKCVLHYHQPFPGNLLLWATPATADGGVALGRGQAFVQGWVKRVLSFGMVKPSFYWTEMQSTMTNTNATENLQGAGTFQNSDTCLKAYRAGTGASEIDCLLSEEAAKREGHFRLVYDDVTKDVVTLKELLKRDRHRASGTGNANLVTVGPSGTLAFRKRKPEDEESGDDKRMCM